MTTTRTAYTAGTPDRPVFFSNPQDDPRLSDPGASTPSLSLKTEGVGEKLQGKWHGIVEKTRDVCRNNTGMLLIGASQVRQIRRAIEGPCATYGDDLQGFFALMNVAVKKLNSLDPPVSVMELVAVRMVRVSFVNTTRCFVLFVLPSIRRSRDVPYENATFLEHAKPHGSLSHDGTQDSFWLLQSNVLCILDPFDLTSLDVLHIHEAIPGARAANRT